MKKAKIPYEDARMEVIILTSSDIVTTSPPDKWPHNAPSTSDGAWGSGDWVEF